MHKIVVTTGYMGSGSSAFTDLISEFEGFQYNRGSFEYIFLHGPNGLFDLEDKLLINNNALRSDEALASFRSEMNDLFFKFNWWPSNYKEMLSPEFMSIVDSFIASLTNASSDSYWYHQQKLNSIQNLQSILYYIEKYVTGGRINKVALNRKSMRIAIPSPEEFYEKAKDFLGNLFIELGIEKHPLLIDQLLLPHNLWRFNHYFDSNVFCVVVDRDPRDVFLSNKYVWAQNNQPIPFPFEVNEFCDYYQRMRKSVKPFEHSNIIEVHFEDLIYNYESTVISICDLIGLPPEKHIRKKQLFRPDESINNTQLFTDPRFRSETEIIQRELDEFLYQFPYKHEIDIKHIF